MHLKSLEARMTPPDKFRDLKIYFKNLETYITPGDKFEDVRVFYSRKKKQRRCASASGPWPRVGAHDARSLRGLSELRTHVYDVPSHPSHDGRFTEAGDLSRPMPR
jgi:hypothetical protein